MKKLPLTFKDIGDWSPASISIVDQPSHPLAIFEVYEDDDEFIRKYKHIEVNNMSENNDEVKCHLLYLKESLDQ